MVKYFYTADPVVSVGRLQPALKSATAYDYFFPVTKNATGEVVGYATQRSLNRGSGNQQLKIPILTDIVQGVERLLVQPGRLIE